MQVVELIRWSDFGGDSKREGDREFRVLAKEWVKGWSTGAWLKGEGTIIFPSNLSDHFPHRGPLPLDMLLYTTCCLELHVTV